MGLSKPIAKLVQKVFVKYGPEDVEGAQREPETYLIALLLAIRERLPDPSATLDYTVERATFDSYHKAARKYLQKTAASK